MAAKVSEASDSVRLALRSDPVLEAAEIETTRRELLHAQRSAYMDLRRDGLMSEEVFERLVAEVDAGLVAGEDTLAQAELPDDTRVKEVTSPEA